ncbi:hypothetical protein [Sinimarinibacterium sp. NLF-5-8]|uniref:hypothetical protein n=1 Tax=Sinimarinibacterium sp. NLF-5-8 TaxID=2698684 RepID=UPI00137BA6CB|nr:hypothetical protein [Sinimarinibacterium sp. NLF-5-8]QHS09115.1 hypothetical protein GT972_02405 [Sinimarinibacterium sp. NLF-5-8]
MSVQKFVPAVIAALMCVTAHAQTSGASVSPKMGEFLYKGQESLLLGYKTLDKQVQQLKLAQQSTARALSEIQQAQQQIVRDQAELRTAISVVGQSTGDQASGADVKAMLLSLDTLHEVIGTLSQRVDSVAAAAALPAAVPSATPVPEAQEAPGLLPLANAFLASAKTLDTPTLDCAKLAHNHDDDWAAAVAAAGGGQRFVMLDAAGKNVYSADGDGNITARSMKQVSASAGC